MNERNDHIQSNVGSKNKMALESQYVNEICDVEKQFFLHFTDPVRQNASRYRLPPELNTPSWPWGRWSICSPDFAGLRCHSTDKSTTWELKTTKHTFHGLGVWLVISCLFPVAVSFYFLLTRVPSVLFVPCYPDLFLQVSLQFCIFSLDFPLPVFWYLLFGFCSLKFAFFQPSCLCVSAFGSYFQLWQSIQAKTKALTGHTLATMVWIFLVFPLLSVSLSRKKKYNLASLGSVPSGIRWASMKIGSKWQKRIHGKLKNSQR